MRTTLTVLAILVVVVGCRRESQDLGAELESTAGGEVSSASAAPMAAIDAEDVELDIWTIDVGQGDATLIVGPEVDGERISMLVDAGRGSSTRAIEPAMAIAGVDGLDIVVATHYDDDHIGGFTTRGGAGGSLLWTTEYGDEELLSCTTREFFPTLAIVDSGPGNRDSGAEEEWSDCAEALTGEPGDPEHIEVEGGNHLGDVFALGGGYTAKIVAGGGHVLGTTGAIDDAQSKNEMSVAILVSNTEGFDFLVTGDLIGQPSDPDEPNALENAKLEKALGEKLSADGVEVEVLQAGHHGAANASENSFISAVQPTVAIISAGMKNSHGHPHNRTLATLEANEVPFILQTSAGKRRDDDPPGHEFAECEHDDSDCVEPQQISVDGTFHIEVDGDKYDITSVTDSSYYRNQSGGLETKMVELECDLSGCVLLHGP